MSNQSHYELVKRSLDNALENGYVEMLTMSVSDIVDDLRSIDADLTDYDELTLIHCVERWKDEKRLEDSRIIDDLTN